MDLATNEFVEKWEHVLKDINKEHVPIDCVKKILFKLDGGRQKTVNLEKLRAQGLELDELEVVVTRTLLDLSKEIVNMDFVIDVHTVAKHIQPITDDLLRHL